MKALKFLTLVIAIVLITGLQTIMAQTFQQELYATIDDEYVFCLNKKLSGEWTYHTTYHIDKKTGLMSKLHWNVKKANLWDSEGNTYKLIDTGGDNLGAWWDYFNNVNAYNTDKIDYNVEDGWLPVPDILPMEGKAIQSTFKFIGNGEKVTWTFYWYIKLDKNGEIKFDIFKEELDCNY